MTSPPAPDVRTIAELRAEGFDGLRVDCPGCGWTVCSPWTILRLRPTATVDDARRRMQCSRCGTGPGWAHVRPWAQRDDQPTMRA